MSRFDLSSLNIIGICLNVNNFCNVTIESIFMNTYRHITFLIDADEL